MQKKFCACGCGGLIPLAPYTRRACGWIKGQPRARFIHGHKLVVPVKQRFLHFIRKDARTGCWLWTGNTCAGYGRLQVAGCGRSAHRVSWQIYRGKIPAGIMVCHRCDVRGCVNPRHLFLGSAADNLRDMVNKGRSARGSRVGSARLSENQVLAIRRARGRGVQGVLLAARYRVSPAAISAAFTGRTWKYLEARP